MVLLFFLATLCVITSNEVGAQLNLLGLQLDLLGTSQGHKSDETTAKIENAPTVTTPTCIKSITKVSNSVKVCKGDLIFEDDFHKPFLNKNLWDVEQYIPTSGPDYEFVSYENTDDTLSVQDSRLSINPVPRLQESEIRGTLDLRQGCTSKLATECFHQQISSHIIPPVKSAKVSTKFAFAYGKIEIKAKLPKGDWIYPQIELVPRRKDQPGLKMWIAYSRGNSHYIGRRDEGSRLLFGGIITGPRAQDRIRFTRTRPSLEPYGNFTHTYTLIWERESIILLLNGEEYGEILIDAEDKRFFPFEREFYLTLGVGVGGINDFPDTYTSNPTKPWNNADSKQMKNFFDARNQWLPSWAEGNSVMEVDSVKIFAV